MISVNIYRYNPEKDSFPYMQTFEFEKPKRDIMVLELLNQLKEKKRSYHFFIGDPAEKEFVGQME